MGEVFLKSEGKRAGKRKKKEISRYDLLWSGVFFQLLAFCFCFCFLPFCFLWRVGSFMGVFFDIFGMNRDIVTLALFSFFIFFIFM